METSSVTLNLHHRLQLDEGGSWLLSGLLPESFLSLSLGGIDLSSLGGHALRVGAYSYLIAEAYGLHTNVCERFRIAAALHDIGKTALPPELLAKPTALSPKERQLIETHTSKGCDLLLATGNPSLTDAALIAQHHHENMDGSGYPHKLRGKAIPLGARVVRVADTFDAITSRRVYSEARSVGNALELLGKGRGKFFDSDILDAFEVGLSRYPGVSKRLAWFTTDLVGPSDFGHPHMTSPVFKGNLPPENPFISAIDWTLPWQDEEK